MASSERIEKILEAETTIVEKENPLEIKEFKSSIVYKNVHFRYDTENVLKNINLTIEKGKTIALVGQSGSGKSTLVDLLARFYDVSKGDILIDIGEQIQFIPLIIEGAVKVLREDASGDEILLYFVDFGNTCAMTLNCCMENTPSEIRAVCEADTSLIMIPATYMDSWLAKYKSWRIFIFDNFQYHHLCRRPIKYYNLIGSICL